MTTETLFTSETPDTDSNDPGTKHTYGMRWASTAAGTISTGRIWCPNPKPPTYFGWALFRVSDQALLSSVDLTAVSLTAGAWNAVTLPSSVTISSSETYVVAAHYEGGHQVFSTTGVSFPLSHSTHLSADTGMFKNGGTPTDYPSSTFALYGFADVDFVAGSPSTNAPAEAPAGTGAANTPSVSVNSAAEGIAATGAALDPSSAVSVAADAGLGAGSALDASTFVFAASEGAAAASAAYDATVSVAADVGLATGVGEAFDPPITPSVGAQPRITTSSHSPRIVSTSDGRRL
jgi:hypothetical protein